MKIDHKILFSSLGHKKNTSTTDIKIMLHVRYIKHGIHHITAKSLPFLAYPYPTARHPQAFARMWLGKMKQVMVTKIFLKEIYTPN